MKPYVITYIMVICLLIFPNQALAGTLQYQPDGLIKTLTTAPHITVAGDELTVSAELCIPEDPKTVTVVFSEVGPKPQKIEVSMQRQPNQGDYVGHYTFPEVIDHAAGFIPRELHYTVVTSSGENDVVHQISSADGAFFVSRQKTKLLSWDIPTAAPIGSRVTIGITFSEPLPFKLPTRIEFVADDPSHAVSFQTEPLVGPGPSYTVEADLPAAQGRYRASLVRVGEITYPLKPNEQATITAEARDSSVPQLTGIVFSAGFSSATLQASFDLPDNVLQARVRVQGPFHSQNYVQLTREGSSFALNPEDFTLPFTGSYYINQLEYGTSAGKTISIEPPALWQWGQLSFFSFAPSEQIVAPPLVTTPQLVELAVNQESSDTYHVSVGMKGLEHDRALLLTFKGRLNSISTRCEFDLQSQQWQGTIIMPNWAEGGTYRLVRAIADDGSSVSIPEDYSFDDITIMPDTTPPKITAITGTVKDGLGTTDITFDRDESGVKAVRLYYLNRTTRRTFMVNAGELTYDHWQAVKSFTPDDLGYWALTAIQVEDHAGNSSMLGSVDYDSTFYPTAGLHVFLTSLDRFAPTTSDFQINNIGKQQQLQLTLADIGRGVDLESLLVYVDEAQVAIIYDQDTGLVVTQPLDLVPGPHKLTIHLADHSGNTSDAKWPFIS